jgi:hypothetical protein
MVENGSTFVDIKGPFTATDGSGVVRNWACVYNGAAYAPTSSDGLFAGTLTCFDDKKPTKVYCTRPKDNRATTCGGAPAENCGTLGKDCPKFYQLLATCRM